MLNNEGLLSELQFTTSRSGGAAGQHVNKVESKVTLMWLMADSTYLDDNQKALLRKRLQHRLTKDGMLLLESSADRSQMRNKSIVIARFFALITQSLKQDKKRIATKIPKAKILERMDRKKKHAEKKASRRNRYWD